LNLSQCEENDQRVIAAKFAHQVATVEGITGDAEIYETIRSRFNFTDKDDLVTFGVAYGIAVMLASQRKVH
jgi:hypothetical protein